VGHTAAGRGPVASHHAIQDPCMADEPVEQPAAGGAGRVARNRAGFTRELAPAPDAPAVPEGAVVVDGAVCNRQRAPLNPDATAVAVLGNVVVDGATVDGDGTTRRGDAATQPDRSLGDDLLVAADLAAVGDDHRVAQQGADAAADHQGMLGPDPLKDLIE